MAHRLIPLKPPLFFHFTLPLKKAKREILLHEKTQFSLLVKNRKYYTLELSVIVI
jgi:hypothetical protein